MTDDHGASVEPETIRRLTTAVPQALAVLVARGQGRECRLQRSKG
jgi:hypothetical protein